VKPWGAASPHLFTALLNDEVLTSVRFEFVRPIDAGEEEPLRTIQLKNARVVAIEQVVDDTDDGFARDRLESERVYLSFVEMTIEHFRGTTVVSAGCPPIAAESSRMRASRAPVQRPNLPTRELGRSASRVVVLSAEELKILHQILAEQRKPPASEREALDERTP
jgi:hypothetical protein